MFLCEFVTGGGFAGQPLPVSLAREGALMRDALARDLAELPGVSLTVAQDPQAPPCPFGAAAEVSNGDPWDFWEREAAACDLFWPVAPETDGLQARLAALGRAAGVQVMAPSAEAIRVASSKSLTAARLQASGVPTPPTFSPDRLPPTLVGACVSKPDDGAGCEGVRLWDAPPSPRDVPADHVLQPYVAGAAASLTVLNAFGRVSVLAANRQSIAVADGAIALAGLDVGALDRTAPELRALAQEIVAAIPGLDGLFGVDLALPEDGGPPVAIEINPRVTTAYVALREALGVNPLTLLPPFATEAREPPSVRPVEIRL
ncbi:ATP-grasp domain-containing protein [Methylopila musalis]|uniref:ATP-grasp domain-containing protein n=1 Tax=Methylopila musalis TaxID=1134781 RepID=A0ABW3Z8L0_9HYPH